MEKFTAHVKRNLKTYITATVVVVGAIAIGEYVRRNHEEWELESPEVEIDIVNGS